MSLLPKGLLFGPREHCLTLSADYVRHWGPVEAVRELIQNAIDSDSPFDYSFTAVSCNDMRLFRLTSRNTTLHPRTLILGHTTKADRDDAIGSFGEGFKIALLVLTRSGRHVQVLNGARLWTPFFQRVEAFDADLLHIRDEALNRPNEGLTFLVALTPEEATGVVESCLLMQEDMEDAVPVRQGRILPSRPGKLYVGGLFICDTQLEHGYDVNPGEIQLERDRQTVAGFELQHLATQMWFDARQPDRVAEMLSRGVPDVALAQYSSPDLVKEACYRLFNERNPGKVIARDQKELDSLVERGLVDVVVERHTPFYANVSQAPSYKEAAGSLVRVPTPVEVLTEWYEQNRKHFHRVAHVNMKALLRQALNWRNK